MLQIKELNFSYGETQILKDIHLSFSSGEFIAIIGPNGAGKSTMIKAIDGILPTASSMIYLNNRSIKHFNRRELAQNIAYLAQESSFTFNYSIREVVLMGRFPYLKGVLVYSAEDLQIVSDMMQLMEIEHFADRGFNDLSGGEKQRVLIASALAQRPNIILLDEPTNALDLYHQIAIFQILKKLQQEQQLTIVVVTHDINLAAQFCERIILMHNGQIIRDDKPKNVLQFQLLQETFGVEVYIDINPLTKSLYILPYA